MSGGSIEPEGPDDYQCEHCGLYYARVGLRSHEPNCDRQNKPPLRPVEGTTERRERDAPTETGPDGRDDSTPESGATPEGDTARTDGLGLAGPPESTTEEEPSEGVKENGGRSVTCPHCGHDHEESPDEIDRSRKYRCGECKNTAEGSELL